MNNIIAVVSGGLDSVTMAHDLADSLPAWQLHLLTFDYGQRHSKEMGFATMCANDLGAQIDVIDLKSVGRLLKGSSLTDASVEVPEGHYAAANMASTVVPSRNAVMLAIAFSIGVAEKADLVAIGVHAGDHFIYPDCRPEFIRAFGDMEKLANDGGPILFTPFIRMSKADIVRRGNALGVPFSRTWSCYKGGDVHCGVCGTCVERKEAFALAGVIDSTIYSA